MHGDYSRGHEPDRKRGRDYRRVLLQMGRPVLDSDVASTVDAVLGQVRAATRGLGCSAGSPDLGFLVTPGRLLSVPAESAGSLTVTGTPDVWLDYRHRFAGRYPALHVAAGGAQARVTLPLLQRPDPAGPPRAALWARVEAPTAVSINGTAVNLAPDASGRPQRFEFAIGAPLDPLELTLDAGEQVWLFLLEQDEPPGAPAGFWIAPGSYHVDGLVADARGGGRFPAATFPTAAGFGWNESPVRVPLDGLIPGNLSAGTRLVAYLETWERHITAIEDPGIREEALGSTDTSTRTELLGQVKLATLAGTLPPGPDAAPILRDAFGTVIASGGRLVIEVPETTPTTDPCALPELAGYSGSDNRLYRVEVHRGGGLADLRLKWSRDNGSELFAADLNTSGELVFPAFAAPSAGDIVEVLSHVVDLGDDALGVIGAAGFTPPRRAVGQLAQLVAVDVAAASDDVVFRLVDPDDVDLPVQLDDRYGDLRDSVLKLRRWHGLLDPQGSGGPHVLEDGIGVQLPSGGSYRPGQYWQYEARVRGENANGPWRPDPHGPERCFAPLALLEFQGEAEPLRLLAWLDERFSRVCELDADDIDFAGDRVGTESDTVQEALEEIYERLPPIVPWPTVAADGINWVNDRELPLPRFNEGLRVTFSDEMHPATATPAAFVVAIEVPAEEGAPGLRRSLVVNGRVDVDGSAWTFVPSALDEGDVGRWVRDLDGPVRCRVRLASHVILDRAGRPLDGDTVGRVVEDGYDAWIDLRLPSGDGQRGGDFESWFYLTGPAPLVAVDHVNPADGVKFEPGTGPRSILISFSDNLRFDSITPKTLSVSVEHSSRDQEGEGKLIPGTIQPYPFESEPGVVSRVTFAPDDPEALRPTEAPATGAWVYTVRVRGTGSGPVTDLEDRPLDGAGTGEASDFVSRFLVETRRG